LVDADFVETTNLNRLVNGVPGDVEARTPKCTVAERFIRALHSDAEIVKVEESFVSERGFAALRDSDCIFGCVDRDGARVVLNEFAQAYEIPYLDVATGIPPNRPTDFGGRIFFSIDGEACVCCADLLDQDLIQEDFESEGDKRDHEAIYGVSRGALGNSGPSVISLNGILSSLAVTEFLIHVTGLRPAAQQLTYRGSTGIVTVTPRVRTVDCPYCKPGPLRGAGDLADVQRWIRDGWGTRLR
jgi:molybdopterin/thiamine biosynthesis adenylyltransferase